MHEKETDDKVVDVSGKHERWLHVLAFVVTFLEADPRVCHRS
jgi:hypothetical protein